MNHRDITTLSLQLICLISMGFTSVVLAASTARAPFPDSTLDAWQERSFKGHSQYELVGEGKDRTLRASTNGQASMLYKELTIALTDTPILSWQWKVENVFNNTNEQTRKGDDFPARVYVAYRYGKFPWQVYAISYVWASHSPIGDSWSSPYTKKAKIIALQSGSSNLNQWQFESRNVVNDFAQAFGVNVRALDGVAVMVDADNTGMSAVAHFAAIEFHRER